MTKNKRLAQKYSPAAKDRKTGCLDALITQIEESLPQARLKKLDIFMGDGQKLQINRRAIDCTLAEISSPRKNCFCISFPDGTNLENKTAHDVVQEVKIIANMGREQIYTRGCFLEIT